MQVLATHRGRCGEYSVLALGMLRALGYTAVRWVMDGDDHVSMSIVYIVYKVYCLDVLLYVQYYYYIIVSHLIASLNSVTNSSSYTTI